jgi:hypothetical protein
MHQPVPVTDPPVRSANHRSVLATLGHAAVVATKNGAIPLTLLLLVGLFLAVQNRLDRSDPKLALAPVYADPGVSFVPAMS